MRHEQLRFTEIRCDESFRNAPTNPLSLNYVRSRTVLLAFETRHAQTHDGGLSVPGYKANRRQTPPRALPPPRPKRQRRFRPTAFSLFYSPGGARALPLCGASDGRAVIRPNLFESGDISADRVGTTRQRGMDTRSSDPLHLSLPPICCSLSVAGNMHRASAPPKKLPKGRH